MPHSGIVLILLLTCLLSSCRSPGTKQVSMVQPPAPVEHWHPYQTGIASWYGRREHGGKTASGQRMNQWQMTAAHRKLPFGTKVRVTSLRTGKSCVVRINDRGPFVRGRVIDVSTVAARQIGLEKSGVAKVKLELLK